jgi:protease I
MTKPLLGEKIAVLVANGFSEKDLTLTQKALMGSGAVLKIVSMDQGLVNSWNEQGWGLNFAVDQQLSEALAADYDVLIVPGGQRSNEKLKMTAHTRRFVGGFMNAGKPVVLFEDAVDLLAFADKAQDVTLCGPERLQAAAVAAGAKWSEEASCVSGLVMSGRSSESGSEALCGEVVKFLSAASLEKAVAAIPQAA